MQIRHQPDFIYFKIKLYKIEFEISLRRLSLLCRLTDIKIAWINPCDESKQQTSLNSFKKSLKNGNHKISHADYAKFILMVSAFTFSNAINAERFYCFVFFLLFFHSEDTELVIYSIVITEMTLLYRPSIFNALIFNVFILHMMYLLT